MKLYKAAKGLFYLYMHTFYDVEYIGRGNLPKDGAVIICANHKSVSDPLLLGGILERPIHFMAKQEIFKNKFFAWVLREIGAFPVNRETVEMTSFKHALGVLKNGEIMGIFSQATRKNEINENEGKAGVALFATKSGAPVVPVGISGNYKWFSKMTINMGEPIDFTRYRDKKLRTPELEELTKEIMGRVKQLVND